MASGSQNMTSYEVNKLSNGRELYVDLSTTRNANSKILFDGAADKVLQVSGTLAVGRGGTGQTSWTQWGVLYASTTSALANTGAGTAGYLLQSNATSAPSWIQATNSNTASTIVKRDASGNFSAGTITATLSGEASTAAKWTTARDFTIKDADNTNAGTATSVQGNENEILHLPSTIKATLTGNADTATEGKYLMNRGGSTVSIEDSSWGLQHTPSGQTNRAIVFSQKWTQSGLTYTPSGGSATAISDTADYRMWLSSGNASNTLQVNMQLDGVIYALGGFIGNATSATTATSLSCGITTNNIGTYGNVKLTTKRGGYYGILLGETTSNINVMSSGQYNGLFCEAKGRWAFCYDSTNDKVGIGTYSIASSYFCQINGHTYINTLTVGRQNTDKEGGEIILEPATSSFSTIHIDQYQNFFRIHDGSTERFKVDVSTGNATLSGAFTANSTITANGGYLKSTLNGNTVTIGSQNANWCHFTNSASGVNFYFDREIWANGKIGYYNTKSYMDSDGIHVPKNGGVYWDPYVESTSDASDVSSIYQIASGVAGGTELRINQQNDAADCINLCTNSYIYLNSKRAFTISDSWLRINEDLGFSSGIYTGSSLIRTDNELEVGSSGSAFLATSAGLLRVTGSGIFYRSDGSIKMYTVDGNHGCGNETVVIQSCFDDTDPQTSNYTSSYAGRCNIAMQPRGGQVFIGGVPANGNTKTYKLYVAGRIQNSNGYLDLSGTASTCPDGTAITQPGGANALELVSYAASGRDCGIFHISNDNAYICNSADSGYLFAVFDTDKTQNFSDGTNASFYVKQNQDGAVFKGTVTADGFSGPLTGNVTGNCSGSSGSCTGNAATATTLQTARNLWGNSFNGSADISGTLTPGTNHGANLGSSSLEWESTNSRVVYARHYDASYNYTGDRNMYYGYNRGNAHYFYKNDGSTRTHLATIDGSLSLPNGSVYARVDSGEAHCEARNATQRVYLYAHSNGSAGIYRVRADGTAHSIIQVNNNNSTSTFYGNCTGSAGSVAWSGITSKPISYFSGHSNGSSTNNYVKVTFPSNSGHAIIAIQQYVGCIFLTGDGGCYFDLPSGYSASRGSGTNEVHILRTTSTVFYIHGIFLQGTTELPVSNGT